MASVTVSIPLVAGAISDRGPLNAPRPPWANSKHFPLRAPKVTMISETGTVLRIPFAPSELTLEKLTPAWSTIERPGKQELLVYERNQLTQVTFTIFIAAENQRDNPLGSVEEWITNFRRHISAKQRWLFNYKDQVDKNWWRFTDVSISTQLRSPKDNSIAVATADIQLTQASDIAIRTGPVTGGVTPTSPKPSSGTGTYTTYTIKSVNDTLWSLAVRFLGNGTRWTEIAALNKITDPRKIRIGQVIKIPNAKSPT